MFSRRRALTRGLPLLLLAFLEPCTACEEWYVAELRSQRDFAAYKTQHVGLVEATGKVVPFRHLDLVTGETVKVPGDKRYRMLGTSVEGNGSVVVLGPNGVGLLAIGVTFAFNSELGLTSGQSAGTVMVDYGDQEGLSGTRQLAVVYRDDLSPEEGLPPVSGLRAIAFDGSLGIVGTVDFPGVCQVDVRLEQNQTQFLYKVRATPLQEGGAEQGDPLPFTGFAVDRAPSATGFSSRYGAQGLGKKGAFYVDRFWFICPEAGGPFHELSLTASFGSLAASLQEARDVLAEGPTLEQVAFVADLLEEANNTVAIPTMFQIESLIENEEFQSATQSQLAFKSATSISSRLDVSVGMLDGMVGSGQVDTKKVASVVKRLDALIGTSRVGMANMQGLAVRNTKQLGFLHPIPDRDLPSFLQPP